jgi:hypothetical protein
VAAACCLCPIQKQDKAAKAELSFLVVARLIVRLLAFFHLNQHTFPYFLKASFIATYSPQLSALFKHFDFSPYRTRAHRQTLTYFASRYGVVVLD